MITEEQKQTAQFALEESLNAGCKECRVTFYKGSSSELEVRNGKTDYLKHSSDRQLSISLYVDGRFSVISTNNIDRKEIADFIRNGVKNCRHLSPDPYRMLPDKSLYYKGDNKDMGLYDYDFAKVTIEDKAEIAQNTMKEIADKEGRIISASVMADDYEQMQYTITSNGLDVENRVSVFALSATVSVKGEEDERPEAWSAKTSSFWDKLQRTGIGTDALTRAIKKIGSGKIDEGRYTVIVENRVINQLFAPMISAIRGEALQQRSSFLLDKKEERIVSPLLTIADMPLMEGHSGARCFDDEGVASKNMSVIEKGVLKNYFISQYISRKTGMEATTGSPSVLIPEIGDKSLAEMISECEKGIFITDFNGGNCNDTTGDFSYGAEGFLIENGILTTPFSEMIITGDMLTLWNNLSAVGNDPRMESARSLPSMRFEDVSVS